MPYTDDLVSSCFLCLLYQQMKTTITVMVKTTNTITTTTPATITGKVSELSPSDAIGIKH